MNLTKIIVTLTDSICGKNSNDIVERRAHSRHFLGLLKDAPRAMLHGNKSALGYWLHECIQNVILASSTTSKAGNNSLHTVNHNCDPLLVEIVLESFLVLIEREEKDEFIEKIMPGLISALFKLFPNTQSKRYNLLGKQCIRALMMRGWKRTIKEQKFEFLMQKIAIIGDGFDEDFVAFFVKKLEGGCFGDGDDAKECLKGNIKFLVPLARLLLIQKSKCAGGGYANYSTKTQITSTAILLFDLYTKTILQEIEMKEDGNEREDYANVIIGYLCTIPSSLWPLFLVEHLESGLLVSEILPFCMQHCALRSFHLQNLKDYKDMHRLGCIIAWFEDVFGWLVEEADERTGELDDLRWFDGWFSLLKSAFGFACTENLANKENEHCGSNECTENRVYIEDYAKISKNRTHENQSNKSLAPPPPLIINESIIESLKVLLLIHSVNPNVAISRQAHDCMRFFKNQCAPINRLIVELGYPTLFPCAPLALISPYCLGSVYVDDGNNGHSSDIEQNNEKRATFLTPQHIKRITNKLEETAAKYQNHPAYILNILIFYTKVTIPSGLAPQIARLAHNFMLFPNREIQDVCMDILMKICVVAETEALLPIVASVWPALLTLSQQDTASRQKAQQLLTVQLKFTDTFLHDRIKKNPSIYNVDIVREMGTVDEHIVASCLQVIVEAIDVDGKVMSRDSVDNVIECFKCLKANDDDRLWCLLLGRFCSFDGGIIGGMEKLTSSFGNVPEGGILPNFHRFRKKLHDCSKDGQYALAANKIYTLLYTDDNNERINK